MNKYLTTDQFVEVVTRALKATLERDFGKGEAHIVDLMTHAATGMEWMYQFMDSYIGVEHSRAVEDVEPIVKSSKKSK